MAEAAMAGTVFSRRIAGGAAFLALFLGDQPVLAAQADPSFRIKNVILMIADGSGANSIAATGMYTGKLGKEIFDGPEWTKSWVSTYPLRTGAMPLPGPDGLTQDPDTIYDPAKNWDATPMEAREGRFGDRFAGYRWTKATSPDSANTMSAAMTGTKSYNAAINVDGSGEKVLSFAERAARAGKAVGIVTTAPFSDATPAAAGGAHNVSRANRKEIAHEMLSTNTIRVVMGAGNPEYDDNGKKREEPSYEWIAPEDWSGLHQGASGFLLIDTKEQFDALARTTAPPRKVAGIVHSLSGMQAYRQGLKPSEEAPYSVARRDDLPSLSTMARGALNILSRDIDGMFLMIETEGTDDAMHSSNIGRMIEERIEFNEAIADVVAYVNSGVNGVNWSNTLLVVTADHDHLLLGPDSDTVPYQPLVDMGMGRVPGYRWQSAGHSNQLVPLFARGMGAAIVKTCSSRTDAVTDAQGRRFGRGAYMDQTQILQLMLGNPRCQ
jgi:alkaline phosphatase